MLHNMQASIAKGGANEGQSSDLKHFAAQWRDSLGMSFIGLPKNKHSANQFSVPAKKKFSGKKKDPDSMKGGQAADDFEPFNDEDGMDMYVCTFYTMNPKFII